MAEYETWEQLAGYFDGDGTIATSDLSNLPYKLNFSLWFVDQSEEQIRMVRDFLRKNGRITGNELMAVFRQEVEAGRRERRPRRVVIDVPYTRPEGLALMKAKRSAIFRDSFGRFRSKVTPEDFDQIRFKHFKEGKRLADLVREYPQYAKETIRRVLGRGRGYVGVKGIGSVDTTDTTIRDPPRALHG